ncbi:hypothetical protein AMS58_13005 [Pseudoalteromonas porphyrae]|uniref:tryptophan halogenase family protein n=1 Tax=Pseudoalteromonas porphyrae TaxID=187330 RepID=UPI0006BAA023|nr:tryptophan halogenase family protein [Pseudoalteromonas porphyrae]KPH94218.1 hypothetical protein AMS58_13005 [Pseudoalteromonas porphyrae]
MNAAPNHILIVGGGTAGWMAANLFAHQWKSKGIKVSLIESDVIGTVGVGEGSTPFLKDFFEKLEIPESQWMKEANATYKCGISFPGWSTHIGFDSYIHPFYSMVDSSDVPIFFEQADIRRRSQQAQAHPDHYFVTSKLIKNSLSPILKQDKKNKLDYGYHFDAELLGRFLAKNAVATGVAHIKDKVTSINLNPEGNIESVTTVDSGVINADIFIDCSGFRGMLIQGALGEKLISYESYLPNDSAVAIQTPLEDMQEIPSETVSAALKYGWAWKIPLMNRFGNGYVYSSKYITPEQAEAELKQHLGISKDDKVKSLHLKWTPGRISNHWKKNCLALGLSQGFLEPLEAPMLNIIQQTCESFIACLEASNFSEHYMPAFNTSINQLIDGTRDYLQGHYKLNSRTDTQYWIDVRENQIISNELSGILKGWYDGRDFNQVLRENLKANPYQKTSWYCMLAGLGYFKSFDQISDELPESDVKENLKLESQFYTHAEQLRRVSGQG